VCRSHICGADREKTMVIVCNIDGEYEVEEQQPRAVEPAYEDEVLCANLMPQVAEFTREAQAFERQQAARHGAMPIDLAFAEVEAFLSRMYAAQE
jgi:hypothetical protein